MYFFVAARVMIWHFARRFHHLSHRSYLTNHSAAHRVALAGKTDSFGYILTSWNTMSWSGQLCDMLSNFKRPGGKSSQPNYVRIACAKWRIKKQNTHKHIQITSYEIKFALGCFLCVFGIHLREFCAYRAPSVCSINCIRKISIKI